MPTSSRAPGLPAKSVAALDVRSGGPVRLGAAAGQEEAETGEPARPGPDPGATFIPHAIVHGEASP